MIGIRGRGCLHVPQTEYDQSLIGARLVSLSSMMVEAPWRASRPMQMEDARGRENVSVSFLLHRSDTMRAEQRTAGSVHGTAPRTFAYGTDSWNILDVSVTVGMVDFSFLFYCCFT
jgi:hypothetical protein